MKYKYILFDWDGCLARTLDVWLASYKQTLTELGIKKTDKEIVLVFGSWHGGSELGAPDNDKFFERVDQLVENKMPLVKLYDKAAEIVQKLNSRNFRLALLSSSIRSHIEPAMKANKIYSFFEMLITGEEVKKHKPDPEGINLALRKMNASKKSFIMIGDSTKDILAAKNAGVDSILFYPKEHKLYYDLELLKKSHPTYIANSFDDIFKILTSDS
jgi:pyrophosphatase PpaX